MSRERVLYENWPQQPLSSFSGRNDTEFSNHRYSGTFEVMRRELPRVIRRFTSYVPIQEVEVLDGELVIHQRILTQTGPVDSIRGSGAAELLSKIKALKLTRAKA